MQTSKSINVNFYNLEFRQDLTCENDSYTHTHTHAHTLTHIEQHDISMAIGKSTDLPKKYVSDKYIINDTCAHNGSSRILGQLQVRPANIEPGRVLRMRPDRAASRSGLVLGREISRSPTNHGK